MFKLNAIKTNQADITSFMKFAFLNKCGGGGGGEQLKKKVFFLEGDECVLMELEPT